MTRPIAVASEANIIGDIIVLESYPLAISYKSSDDWRIIFNIIHYVVGLILPIFYICDIVNYKSHRNIFLLFSLYIQCYILYIAAKYYNVWCIKILAGIIIMMHVIIIFEIYKKNETDIRE
jgi:hypothetical protein